jgi:hypothetical protein
MPLTVEHSLNRALDSALHDNLINDLTKEPNFAQKATELLAESEEITEKRRVLIEQKDRLLQIRRLLLNVSMPADDEENLAMSPMNEEVMRPRSRRNDEPLPSADRDYLSTAFESDTPSVLNVLY